MFQLQLLLRDEQLQFVPSLQEVQDSAMGIVNAILQAGCSVEDLGAKVSVLGCGQHVSARLTACASNLGQQARE